MKHLALAAQICLAACIIGLLLNIPNLFVVGLVGLAVCYLIHLNSL